MKHKLMFLFLLFGIFNVSSQKSDTYFNALDAFFKAHVNDGKVDYKAIKANPIALTRLIEMAKNNEVSMNTPDEYQAFWINTYNLLVIKGVVDNYPLHSPLDVDGFFDKKQYEVGGKSITLNGIENNLLRAKFPNEPRFHFVLVCAGLGCPPIINEAYRSKTLENQLERQTEKALNDPNFIRVEGENVKISQIFEWYKGDFEKGGGIVEFINKFRRSKLPRGAQIGYYPYDWTLNALK
ncbi:DUF547 domain-containing protein [Maribacter sp. X9]|uniref:DUF547 domain-containing protein n=1 Tax=Maribacter sp. X9 TaxID=3402159 RepID=UPI003AF38C0B